VKGFKTKYTTKLRWACGLAALLAVMLFFGLKPKGLSLSNNARWISQMGGGLSLGQDNLAYLDDFHRYRTGS
jgi:hypothetical protein